MVLNTFEALAKKNDEMYISFVLFTPWCDSKLEGAHSLQKLWVLIPGIFIVADFICFIVSSYFLCWNLLFIKP